LLHVEQVGDKQVGGPQPLMAGLGGKLPLRLE
jgi:hypothetical protein